MELELNKGEGAPPKDNTQILVDTPYGLVVLTYHDVYKEWGSNDDSRSWYRQEEIIQWWRITVRGGE